MLDNAIPQGFEDAVELRRKNRETVVKYMNTKGQDRLRRHELFVEDGCACQSGVWRAPSSGGTWGGSFWSQSGSCINGNPLTGACSCPAGYSTNIQFDIWVNGCWPCRSYSCYKP